MSDYNFIDAEEFIDCFNRGSELLFSYSEKTYSVTRPKGKIMVMESNNYDSLICYETPQEALNYSIDGKHLGDILQDMEVLSRTL